MKMIERLMVALIVVAMVVSISIPAFAEGAKVNMVSMHDSGSDWVNVIEDGITDSYGNNYSGNVLKFDAWYDAFISYDLNGAYNTFDGTIVCSTDTGSSAVMDVGIYADGVKIYELKGFTRQKAAEAVHLDVTGVGTLSIMTTRIEGDYAYLYFVNSTFEKSEKVAAYPNRTSQSDLVVIDSSWCNTSDRLMEDSFGNIHKGWARLDAWYDAYILYNLDKKYVSFTGSIVTGADTGSSASMNIKMFLDDQEVFSKSDITRDTAQIDFDLDVTNASVLRIETSRNDGDYNYVFVTDGVFKAHEHTPSDWSVQKEPTCTEDGERVQICEDCGEVVATEKIPATGHTPDGKWVTESDATCGEEGVQVQHCTVCNEVCDTKKIDKLPHTPSTEWVVEREATCSAEGLKVKKCTVCGETCEEEAIPTVDHSFGDWKTISGSVWDNPIVKERTCSVCGEVERVESNSTSWLKPLVIVLLVIIFGVIAVLIITLKMNGLPLEPASIKKLFSKESLTDDDIDNILNKSDDSENE